VSNVDWARVILAGLVAGVIINLFEFVLNGVIVAKDMEMAIRALGRQMGGVQLAMFSMWAFLVGIFAVWLYAGIRHRFHLDIPQTRP
jgi:hypothetical protein